MDPWFARRSLCVRAPPSPSAAPPTNVSRWLYNRYQLSSCDRACSLARPTETRLHFAWRRASRISDGANWISNFERVGGLLLSQRACCWLGQALFNGLRTHQFSGINSFSILHPSALCPGLISSIFFFFFFVLFCFVLKYRLRSNEDSCTNICSE